MKTIRCWLSGIWSEIGIVLAIALATVAPVPTPAVAKSVPLDRALRYPDGSLVQLGCVRAHQASFRFRGAAAVSGLSWRCDRKQPKPDPAILWIHGGPFSAFDRTRPLPIIQMLIDRGYTIYEPVLHGDEGVEREMIDDRFVRDATLVLDQLETTLAAIRKRHDRVIVLGESLGGFWASMLSSKLLPAETLVLCGPSLLSPREAFLVRAFRTPLERDDGRPISEEERAQFVESWTNLVTSYFGPMLDLSIVDGLAKSSPAPVLLVVGDEDDRIGIDALPALQKQLGNKVEWMIHAGMGHEYFRSASQYDRFARRLDELARRGTPDARLAVK